MQQYLKKAKSEENSVVIPVSGATDVTFDIGDNNGILIVNDLREAFSDAVQP